MSSTISTAAEFGVADRPVSLARSPHQEQLTSPGVVPGVAASGTPSPDPIDPSLRKFGALFAEIRQARSAVLHWESIQSRPDWGEFLVQMKVRMVTEPKGPRTTAILDQVAEATLLNPAVFRELPKLGTWMLRRGRWLPQTARTRRLAHDANVVKEPSPDDDVVTRALTRASRAKIPGTNSRLVPGIKEMNATKGLFALYEAVDFVLPTIDRIGASTAACLEEAGAYFDERSVHFSSDLQKQYADLHRALRPLKLGGFSRASKDQAIGAYEPQEQRMVAMTAGVLGDLAGDLEQTMQLLRDPSKRQSASVRESVQGALRFTLESLASVCMGTAQLIEAGTDENSARLFTVNAVGGAGAMIATCALGGGIGLFVPSLDEYRSTGKTVLRVDFAYPAFTSPFGGAMLNSRGGKWSIKTPLLGVRRSEYSQAVKFGIPFLFGFSLHRDKVFGSGIELSIFPKLPNMGYPGVFDVRGGGNVVIFHPAFSVLDRPVAWLASSLGRALAWSGEMLAIPAKPIGRALSAAWAWLSSAGSPEAVPVNPALPGAKERLGLSMLEVQRASVILGVIRGYRSSLEGARERREPAFSIEKGASSSALGKMQRSYGREGGVKVIEDFLAATDERLSKGLESMQALTSSAEKSPLEEHRLRVQVRRLATQLGRDAELFAYADLLLAQLFPAMDCPPQGPFSEFVH